MRRAVPERLVAAVLTVAMTFSPVLGPVASYAAEDNNSENSGVLGDGPTYEYNPTEGLQDPVGTPAQNPDESGSSNDEGSLPEGGPTTEGTPSEGTTEEGSPAEQQPDATQPDESVKPQDSTTEVAVEVADTTTDAASDSKAAGVATLNAEGRVRGSNWSGAKDVAVDQVASIGTVGSALESVRLSLGLKDISGGISYRAHVSGIGWMDWVADGAEVGASRRDIQTLAIKLTGDVADAYDIQYRVYVQDRGWMDWTANGSLAGTVGFGKAIQSVEMRLVKRAQGLTAASELGTQAFEDTGLTAQAHVQKKGWLKAKSGYSVTIGTTGSSLRMEALKIKAQIRDLTGNINYQAHVQKTGWQGVKKNYQLAGTSNKGRRIEAIRVWLDGELYDNYDVYYRLHVQSIGWMGWAKNGEDSGSAGFGRRVEAIQIALVDKGGAAPKDAIKSDCKAPFIDDANFNVWYDAYWNGSQQNEVKNGKTSGGTGKGKMVKALSARIEGYGTAFGGNIKYRAHVRKLGWTSWVTNDKVVGNKTNQIECISFKLTGKMAKVYDIYYRSHVAKFGWLGWAKNGEKSGSTGAGVGIQAYQVRLVPKYKGAPGSTKNRMISYSVGSMDDLAQQYSSRTNYLVMINNDDHQLGLYKGKKGHWKRVFFTACGTPSGNQVAGQFESTRKVISAGNGYTSWYVTEGLGSGSIHSLIYQEGSMTQLMYPGQIGVSISMGCYRLPINYAKYIYDHCPLGTKMVVYNVG